MAFSLVRAASSAALKFNRMLPALTSPTAKNFLSPDLTAPAFRPVEVQPVRFASKKSAGAVKNRIGRTKKKHRGIKVKDGQFVHSGTILVTQFGLKYYPGENVIMNDQCTLLSDCDGVVVISSEQLNPYPDSPLYKHVQGGLVLSKHFFSIIPTPLHGKFKLVSET